VRSLAAPVSRVALIVLFAACAVALTQLRIETSITHFLPAGDARDKVALNGLLRSSSFSRGMIVDVELADDAAADAAMAFSDDLAQALRDSGPFSSVRNGVDDTFGEEFYRLYFPRRYALISSRPEDEIPEAFSHEGLVASFVELRHELALPTGMMLKQLAGDDPTGAFTDLLRRLEAQRATTAPSTDRGRFCSPDGRHLLLLVETAADAFDSRAQAEAIEALHGAFARVDRAHAGRRAMSFTGLNRFAVESETRIKADVRWASIAATVGVLVLFGLFFRRLRLAAACALPLLFGVVVAMGVTNTVFGSIHGLTLAFGSTLLGVCIDYPVHLVNHLRFGSRGEGRRREERRLLASLVVGMVTTLAGYLMVGFSSFPGVKQIAVFTGAGILASFAFTLAFVPPLFARLLPDRREETPAWMRRAGGWQGLIRVRLPILAVLAVLGVVAAAALPWLRSDSDIRHFDVADPQTRATDEAIRGRLPAASYPLILLVEGDDAEAALQRNDQLHERLAALQASGDVARFASVRWLLPSQQLQQRNLDALAGVEDVQDVAARALAETGFRPDGFAGFMQSLDAVGRGEVIPLTPQELRDSALAEAIEGFVIEFDGATYVASLVEPVRVGDDLSDTLPRDDHLVRLSGAAMAGAVLADSQRQVVRLGLIGLLLNAVVLALYRRRAGGTLTTLAPPLLAILVVLGVLGLTRTPLTVFHVVSLLLVLASGVDYAVFLSDSRRAGSDGPAVVVASVSVGFSALTTALVFGVLALCQTPVLRALGLTVCGGILLSAVFAFCINGVVRGRSHG